MRLIKKILAVFGYYKAEIIGEAVADVIRKEIHDNYHLIPKESDEVPLSLSRVEWYRVLTILYDEGIEMCDLSVYNRLYFAFQDSEIEKINDAAIAQDFINKVNRGEI